MRRLVIGARAGERGCRTGEQRPPGLAMVTTPRCWLAALALAGARAGSATAPARRSAEAG